MQVTSPNQISHKSNVDSLIEKIESKIQSSSRTSERVTVCIFPSVSNSDFNEIRNTYLNAGWSKVTFESITGDNWPGTKIHLYF